MRRITAALTAALTLAAALVGGAAPASASTGSDQTFVRFRASNGMRSNYHFYPSGRSSSGLLVWLDGDGQWGHDHPWSSYALGGSSGLVAHARARNLDVLSVRTPSGDDTWWTLCRGNSTYLADLLAKVTRERGTAMSDIWLVGYSGGAQFATRCYLPLKPSTVPGGGAVVFGGGGAPQLSPMYTDTSRDNLSFHFITGTDDTAENSSEGYDGLWYAKSGHAWYTQNGFSTQAVWLDGYDHNDIGGEFGAWAGWGIDSGRRM